MPGQPDPIVGIDGTRTQGSGPIAAGPQTRGTYDVARLATLSDGVFAIVVTLLVLDIKLPDPPRPGNELVAELQANIPAFVGWLVSFVVLARFWTVHHHIVARLQACRTGTIVWNFAFLGAISLVPFGASLVGTYELDEPLAVAVFSATLGLSAVLLGAFIWHGTREEHLLACTRASLGWHRWHHLIGAPGVAAVAAAVAFVQPIVSVVLLVGEAGAVIVSSASRPGRRA